MVRLPTTELTDERKKFHLLVKWYEAKMQLAKLQASERALRDTVVKTFLPDGGKEGTNTVKLITGDELKIVNSFNRKVDKAVWSSILPQMIEAGIDVNEVGETKVELRVGAYKKLSDKQRAIIDEAVTTTPGSVQVSIKVKE